MKIVNPKNMKKWCLSMKKITAVPVSFRSGEAPGTHLKRSHGVPSGFPVTYFPMQKREKISSSTSTEAVSPVMDAICSIA